MPFEYGSQQVDIPNPFKFEGMAYTARAAVLIALGLISLFTVRGLVADGERGAGIAVALGGLALLGFGAYAAYRRPVQGVPVLRRPRPAGRSRGDGVVGADRHARHADRRRHGLPRHLPAERARRHAARPQEPHVPGARRLVAAPAAQSRTEPDLPAVRAAQRLRLAVRGRGAQRGAADPARPRVVLRSHRHRADGRHEHHGVARVRRDAAAARDLVESGAARSRLRIASRCCAFRRSASRSGPRWPCWRPSCSWG